MTEESYGQRLRTWRTHKGFSQRELSTLLDVSRGYIGDIEAGRSEPSRNFLMRLQEKFGVSPSYILSGEGDVARDEPEKQRRFVPMGESLDPLIMMFSSAAAARAYLRAGRKLPHSKHFDETIWVYDELVAEMQNLQDGDELEEVLPAVEDALVQRLLSEHRTPLAGGTPDGPLSSKNRAKKR